MAKDMNRALADPVLITPQREAGVVGRDVTLMWEPVVGAQAYVVQVARDTSFEEVVVEESVGADTKLRLDNVLPEDRETYYWRVFAQADGAMSPGDHIESFIALTPDQVAAAPAMQPGLDEPIGPMGGLFAAAGAEMVAEVTGSDEAREAANRLGVEPEGVESAQIIGLTLGVLAALAIIVVVLLNWNAILREETYARAATVSGYPELTETERAAAHDLTQYEVLDDAEGVYRVPIDRVITLMSNEAQRGRDSTRTAELPVFDGR